MTENKEGHRWKFIDMDRKWPGNHDICIHCGLMRKMVKKGKLGYSRNNFETYQTRAGICANLT